MASPQQARATQIRNIESRLGRGLEAIRAEVAASGKVKHGEIRNWLIERFGLGHGDANTLAHFASAASTVAPGLEAAAAEIYAGRKAHLRPIHDALIAAIKPWGDFEAAPRKSYVALRRKKQFAMLGPKNAESAALGINLKDTVASERVVAQKPGAACQYVVALRHAGEIDDELLAMLRRAFDAAG
jgi:hypothetical protein